MLAKSVAAVAVCAALISSPWAANAAQEGFYLGAAGGVNVWPEDSELGSQDADLDWGGAGLGALGYAFNNGFRVEGEFGFRQNDIDSISGSTGGSGKYQTTTFMGNLLYDFDRFGLPITPYLGVGVGAGRVSARGVGPVTGGGGGTINDNDTGFAFQGIAGAAYDLNRYLTFTADYRHVRIPDLSFNTSGGGSVDSDYATNQFMLGIRFRFAPPAAKPAPPAPAPAAQPAPPTPAPAPKAEEFIVFFDFDSSSLTPEAQGILQSAADAAKKGNLTRIVLTGHADRAGPADYNFDLSRRRADAVKAELVRLGLPGGEITVEPKGEAEPLVPTADGVPEPQNRRVEILMK